MRVARHGVGREQTYHAAKGTPPRLAVPARTRLPRCSGRRWLPVDAEAYLRITASTAYLTHHARLPHSFGDESDSSAWLRRARARAVRKTIAYQFEPHPRAKNRHVFRPNRQELVTRRRPPQP